MRNGIKRIIFKGKILERERDMKRKEGKETFQYEHEWFLLLRKAEAAGSSSLASPGSYPSQVRVSIIIPYL